MPKGSLHFIGAVSFEDRSTSIPLRLRYNPRIHFSALKISDPREYLPGDDRRKHRLERENEQRLRAAGLDVDVKDLPLLASEDEIVEYLSNTISDHCASVLLDITSLPKRHFCLATRRLMNDPNVSNLIITYTASGSPGHATGHLASDPLAYDNLPGFMGPPPDPDRPRQLVISIGYETLSIRLLLEEYRERGGDTRFILPFPNPQKSVSRQWDSLRTIVNGRDQDLKARDMVSLSPYDTEGVVNSLYKWGSDSNGLSLAPFGPKPHTLGMALYSMDLEAGMYYTQPQAYNSAYSAGSGDSWAYVPKFGGVTCFKRNST